MAAEQYGTDLEQIAPAGTDVDLAGSDPGGLEAYGDYTADMDLASLDEGLEGLEQDVAVEQLVQQFIADRPALQIPGNLEILVANIQARAERLGDPSLVSQPLYWDIVHRETLAAHGDPTVVTPEESMVQAIVNAGGLGASVLDRLGSGSAPLVTRSGGGAILDRM